MCGIVGIVSKYHNGFSNNEVDMFTKMLFIDTFRGWDSTGVFGVDNLGNVEINKAAITGPEFIRTPEYNTFLKEAMSNGAFLVGHNRAATKGSITDENAHPFQVNDKIVLVQNGTMRGDHKKFADTEVDTHAIAHLLESEPDVSKALKQVNAAYVLVWYNVETETLCLIRNSERPLWFIEFENGGFIFASELETILYAVSKSNIATKFKSAPKMLEEHTLYEITKSNKTISLTETKLDCKYEYTSAYEYGETDWSMGTAWSNAFSHVKDAVNHLINDNKSTRIKVNDTEFPIHQIISGHSELDAEFFFNTDSEAQAELQFLLHSGDQDNFAMVTVHDYYYANSLQGCRAFHIISKIYDADITKPASLVHWLAHDTTEGKVKDMIGETFMVKINTPMIITFRDSTSEPRFVVRAYGSNAEKLVAH